MRLLLARDASPADPQCGRHQALSEPHGTDSPRSLRFLTSWPCLMASPKQIVNLPGLLSHGPRFCTHSSPHSYGQLCTHRCKPRWTEMGPVLRTAQGSGQGGLLCPVTRAGFLALTLVGTSACRASCPTGSTLNIFTKHRVPSHVAGSG